MRRKLAAIGRVLCAALVTASLLAQPAYAWKPNTHVYLANIVLRDVVDDGKVTIYETDYASGKVVGQLGSFEVNPAIVAALRAKPDQFRAGVVGPDAYPDMLTGQSVIHPGGSLSLLGSPASGEAPSAPGADAWMTQLWRKAYGPLSPMQQAVETVRGMQLLVPRYDTPEVRAFVAGFLTHGAGDMFMHTFVNHYAGGPFTIQPDPTNAVKHIVLEGYVGLRTPEITDGNVSIDGVDRFIHREMVSGRPETILYDRLLKGEGKGNSVPAMFSKLRRDLQRDVDSYERERMSRSGPSRLAWATVNGPLAEYKKAWIEDIDDGLRAWPAVSHELGKALVYNPNGGVDVNHAKAVASKYAEDHLVSMAGVPDAAVASVAFINKILSASLPPPLDKFLDELKRMPLDAMVKDATGKTLDEWAGLMKAPTEHFESELNQPGGATAGHRENLITLADFTVKVLGIDDPRARNMGLRFEVNKFPPAFNTVQMTKLAFLSEKGMTDLLAALKAKGADVPAKPDVTGNYESAMLGFLTSMDADNEWQGLGSKPGEVSRRSSFLARNGAAAWKKLFMRQIGERADWPGTTASTTDPVSDTGFQQIEQWAVRIDKVEYDASAGGKGANVTVSATFRNDSAEQMYFTDKSMRTTLDRTSGGTVGAINLTNRYKDQASLPPWHYMTGNPVPLKGRVAVQYVYAVGDQKAQSEVFQWTVIEQKRKSALQPLLMVDGKTIKIPVTKLAIEGSPAPTPQAAVDPALLKALEGVYRTNRRTLLTLKVENDKLVGRAINDYVPKNEREQLSLSLMADGSLQGQWFEFIGVQKQWIDLKISFAADNNSFSGLGTYRFSPLDPPLEYKGERVGGEGGDGGKGADGFISGGYFAMRVDAVARQPNKLLMKPVEVMMTARNTQGGRRGIWYTETSYTLLGSDGVEYKHDGNSYGRTGAERMTATVWLEKDEQGAVTYVFPQVPVIVKPVKLIGREKGKTVLELDLANAPESRGAASSAGSGGVAAGEPVTLGQLEGKLVSLNRGADRDWEAVVSYKNTGQTQVKLWDVAAALYDANSETRRNHGDFYYPEAGRRRIGTTIVVPPGGEMKVKYWFTQSANLKPVRYRLQDSQTGQDGSIPTTMLPDGDR